MRYSKKLLKLYLVNKANEHFVENVVDYYLMDTILFIVWNRTTDTKNYVYGKWEKDGYERGFDISDVEAFAKGIPHMLQTLWLIADLHPNNITVKDVKNVCNIRGLFSNFRARLILEAAVKDGTFKKINGVYSLVKQ